MRNERETSDTRETPVYDDETANATPEIAPAMLTPTGRTARAARGKAKVADGEMKPKTRKSRPPVGGKPRIESDPAKPRAERKSARADGAAPRRGSRVTALDEIACALAIADPAARSAESPAAESVPAIAVVSANADAPEQTSAASNAAHHALDAEAEGFFSTARAAESIAPTEHDLPETRALPPHVHVRRAKLARYVRAAVGVCAALCLVALVRGAVTRVSHEREAMASTMTDRAASGDVARAVIARPNADLAALSPAAHSDASPAASTPEATANAITATDAPGPVSVEAPPAKSATEEKKSARVALERGKLKDAIAAGERSIALDPSDGETWLLLGAAYQDSGNGKEARRCFSACTRQGKRGPLNECRMMLR